MATLANDQPRAYEGAPFKANDLPVIAADIIYEGAAVGDNGSGYARPLVAADPFMGFAYRKADNSAGAAGDKNVTVYERGFVVLPVATVAGVGDQGETVYASDDNTFTLVAGGNTAIGKVDRYIGTPSATYCLVYFEAKAVQSL
jgi:hypothetical protein